jgi:hypothetical protein
MKRHETSAEDRDMLADSELNAVSGGVRFNTSLVTVEGHTEATWTPRSYAVQTDLSGGVTGAHASLYEWKRP